MEKQSYNVVGVMSGTSLDGVDLALVNFTKNEKWSFQILKTKIVPYSLSWKTRLGSAMELDDVELAGLNLEYTLYLAQVILEFINKNNSLEIHAVCSHGHTINHNPENNYTLQIGNLPQLAEKLRKMVVCDFRVADVELGGQGAPLVPIGDELLFSNYDYCLNLGGFANISTKVENKRIAYDICPVNTVFNYYAEKLGKEYDKGGEIARSGILIPELLENLDELSFYKKSPPKSLGMEWVGEEIFPLLEPHDKAIPALLHTFSHHIARQIAGELDNDPASKVLVTGGGSFNDFLIEQVKEMTTTTIVIPSEELVNFKEAVIFGFLGVLRMREEINVLSSVTGANKDHSSGVIYEV